MVPEYGSRVCDVAVEDMLVTPAELTDGLGQWLGREDVLEPWLGTRSA